MKQNSGLKPATTACIAIALVAALAATALPASADVSVSAGYGHGIVVDGLIGDWQGIPGTTLTMIRPAAMSERMVDGLTVKLAYDDANLYMLVMVADDYDYNATDHDLSPALAVLWRIDAAATPDMGGGRGNVDVWHWELDCGAGALSGFNLLSGNDPDCNFDDEWSSSPTVRKDDNLTNELYGVWAHTNMAAAGSAGSWIFEMRRSLQTGDTLNQDRQFESGGSYGMAIAYWDADETVAGWTPAGHYATCMDPATLDFSWLNVTLAAPAFETQLAAAEAQIDLTSSQLAAAQAQLATAQVELAATHAALNATKAEQGAQLTAQKAEINAASGAASTATMFGLLGVVLGAAAIGVAFLMGRRAGGGAKPSDAVPPKEKPEEKW